MPFKEPVCADINGIHAAKEGELACARKVNKHKLLTIIVAEAFALHLMLPIYNNMLYCNVYCHKMYPHNNNFIASTDIMCTITI